MVVVHKLIDLHSEPRCVVNNSRSGIFTAAWTPVGWPEMPSLSVVGHTFTGGCGCHKYSWPHILYRCLSCISAFINEVMSNSFFLRLQVEYIIVKLSYITVSMTVYCLLTIHMLVITVQYICTCKRFMHTRYMVDEKEQSTEKEQCNTVNSQFYLCIHEGWLAFW